MSQSLCAMPANNYLWAAYFYWYALHVALLHTNKDIKKFKVQNKIFYSIELRLLKPLLRANKT
jgi:hypothetical protein